MSNILRIFPLLSKIAMAKFWFITCPSKVHFPRWDWDCIIPQKYGVAKYLFNYTFVKLHCGQWEQKLDWKCPSTHSKNYSLWWLPRFHYYTFFSSGIKKGVENMFITLAASVFLVKYLWVVHRTSWVAPFILPKSQRTNYFPKSENVGFRFKKHLRRVFMQCT